MYTLIKKNDIFIEQKYKKNLSTKNSLLFKYSSFIPFYLFLLSYHRKFKKIIH